MTTSPPSPTGSESLTLRGPKVLLQGPTGTGKTTALGTAADWYAAKGWPVYALFTENSTEVFRGYWTDRGLPIPSNVHIADILVKPNTLSSLIDAADKVGKLTYESLTKLLDPNRSGENNAYWKILKLCANFTDTLTGEAFGGLETFPTESLFIMDSLSETANAAFKMQVGNKPTGAPPDYQVAQNNLLNFLRLLTQGVRCGVIVTAHIERLADEISGGTKITTKSIGKALANDIPQLFSDVILTARQGADWSWDTANAQADLKTRNLPVHAKLPPNFNPLFDKWYSRAKGD
jgi:hypothetical protein